MNYLNHYLGAGVQKPKTENLDTKPLRENRVLKAKLQGTLIIILNQAAYMLTCSVEANKRIPRYLFRMWHPLSGGDPKLNSTKRIVPHAFRKDIKLKRTVYDMTMTEFVENTTAHLRNAKNILSEFSSWSASPRFALSYATMHRSSSFIAIIDTEEVQKNDNNGIFHVPALQQVFGTAASMRGAIYGTYDWEYLVHGVIEGKHYQAVSFKTLCDHGLIKQLPELSDYVHAWGPYMRDLPPLVVPYTKKELQELNKIAQLLPPGFRAAFTIALFCCKRRTSFGADLKENELSEIVDALGGRSKVPLDWNGSRSVVCDGIYDPRFQDNQQMVIVMRALSAHCWGKGARNCVMNEGNADAIMGILTEKMRSATVDCDASEESNLNNSNSSYDSGYVSQNYGGADRRRLHHLHDEQGTKPSRKSSTDEASTSDSSYGGKRTATTKK